MKRKWTYPTNDGTYSSWRAMHARCSGRGNNASYYNAVSICDAWMSFDRFYEDMGPRPAGSTLDRIDPTQGYTHNNCRWATRAEQANNQRRSIRLVLRGESLSLAEWARRLSMPYYLVWNRHHAGLPAEEVLSPAPRIRKHAPHGTTTSYSKGCRCDACRAARAAWYAKNKESKVV